MFDLIIRSALAQDCRNIARLFLIGSEGLAEFIVGRAYKSRETIIDVGAHRCVRKKVPLSFENCILVETATQRGLLHASPRLSVVVLQRNQAAMRFYRRVGFIKINRAPLCPHPALPVWTGDAVLLTKSMDKRSKMSESKSQEK